MLHALFLIVLSFGASMGFAVGFGIEKKMLPLAGLCGALSRIVLLTAQHFTDNRIIYLYLAALAAGLMAAALAHLTKRVSTMFLYPAVVPLIPGDLLYYTMLGFLSHDYALAGPNLLAFLAALAGLGFGFSTVNIVRHYVAVSRRRLRN